MRTTTDILGQLERAGLLSYVISQSPSEDGTSISGYMRTDVIAALVKDDARFVSGPLYQLHRDVGGDLAEYRSFRGNLGSGSLQIVIDQKTGHFHCDVDTFNPYQDVVNFFGHAFGEVLPYGLRKLFRRKSRAVVKDMTGQEFPKVDD